MNESLKILLIEDEQVVVDAAARILKTENFEVDHAPTAENGIDMLTKQRYQLILSDLMLPGMSGIDLIKIVKKSFPDLPVIIISGYAMLENALNAFRQNAFDFLPKPFDFEELMGVVNRAINHSKIIQSSARYGNQERPTHRSQLKSSKDEKYYFLGEHSWASVNQDKVITIGVAETFPERMGTVEKIEFPAINSEVWQGNLCVRIISQGNLIHMVWAPLSGKVISYNQEAEKSSKLIDSDPFFHGWLIKILPINLENELKNLVLLDG